MYNCYTHGWSSHHSMCPSCFELKTSTTTDTIMPQNFTAKLYSHDECQAKYAALESRCQKLEATLKAIQQHAHHPNYDNNWASYTLELVHKALAHEAK